ncbi:unnamed protein product [Blepharisma stoltei]|uniref:Rab-GAP TBC domain-containing protein n=1 Tax=Blepharisma stoltei TaxID=1481888 RepID=A0AAU9K3K9_9CILI|nr:unnamed protein product [Blepharisma stoltei]
MSYSEIYDKFDLVNSHMRTGSNKVTSLCYFFKNYRKAIDSYASQVQKLTENLILDLRGDENMDTLSTGLSSFTQHFQKLCQQEMLFSRNIQLEIIEPLELFVNQFNTTNSSLSNQGMSSNNLLSKSKEKLDKLKEKHLKCAETAEKAEALSMKEEVKEKQEKAFKQANYYNGVAHKVTESYEKSVIEMNECLDEYENVMPSIMEALQQSEESRIIFVKSTLERYSKQYAKYENGVWETIEELNAVVGNINSEMDIRVFVEANRSKDEINKREEFLSYEAWKKINQNTDINKPEYQLAIDETDQIQDNELVKIVLSHLIPQNSRESPARSSLSEDSNIDSNYYVKLSELLHTCNGRDLFCDMLDSWKSNGFLQSRKITQLAALIKSMLTSMMTDDDEDPITFWKIVVLSHEYYTEDSGKKRKYLSQFINSHTIWNEASRWIQAIGCAIQTKLEADKASLEKSRKRKRKGLFNSLKKLANNALKKDVPEERAIKSAAFMIISQFNYHMIHMGLPHDLANAVILNVSKKVNLDSERTCMLLAEVQGTQHNGYHGESKSIASLTARNKDMVRYGNLLPIGLAIAFLAPKDCYSLLFVCKSWKEIIYHKILKKWLVEWTVDEDRKNRLRTRAWIELLKETFPYINYYEYLYRVKSDLSFLGELDDIINMDVSRSYQHHPQISDQVLKNILKTYALYNPEIGYCQGMNYIAGTLYLQVQNEEIAFKCLVSMIERFEMSELFIHSLPKLKQFFYQLDRLVGILLPEVNEAFKEVGLSSAHFSAPWFITIFSSILQERANILFPLWDLFLLEGWKIVFKTAITILDAVSGDIYGARFEDIMFRLTNVQVSSSFKEVFNEDFISKIRDVNISNRLLRDLESEYENLKLRAHSKEMQN